MPFKKNSATRSKKYFPVKKSSGLKKSSQKLLGILFFVLLLLGVLATVVLSRISQDIRQQASNPYAPTQCTPNACVDGFQCDANGVLTNQQCGTNCGSTNNGGCVIVSNINYLCTNGHLTSDNQKCPQNLPKCADNLKSSCVLYNNEKVFCDANGIIQTNQKCLATPTPYATTCYANGTEWALGACIDIKYRCLAGGTEKIGSRLYFIEKEDPTCDTRTTPTQCWNSTDDHYYDIGACVPGSDKKCKAEGIRIVHEGREYFAPSVDSDCKPSNTPTACYANQTEWSLGTCIDSSTRCAVGTTRIANGKLYYTGTFDTTCAQATSPTSCQYDGKIFSVGECVNDGQRCLTTSDIEDGYYVPTDDISCNPLNSENFNTTQNRGTSLVPKFLQDFFLSVRNFFRNLNF